MSSMVGEGEMIKSHERSNRGNIGNEQNKEIENRKMFKK